MLPVRSIASLVVLAATAGVVAPVSATDGETATASAGVGYDRVAPLLKTYCFECHTGTEASGGLQLDRWKDAATAAADKRAWERVRLALRRGEMPPADGTQPKPAERAAIVAWIDAAVLGIDCATPRPGKVTIRRLNRFEYQNTLRDLLGVTVDADAFPVDPSGHGFDNLGDVLTLPPQLAEKYVAAAEQALDDALVTPDDRRAKKKRYPLNLLEVGYNAKSQSSGWVGLTSVEEDDLVALHRVTASGEYTLRVHAQAEQKGERPLELTFLLGNEALKTVALDKDKAQEYEAKFRAPHGKQRFRVAMRRIKDGLKSEEAAIWKKGPTQNGLIAIEWLEIEGPADVRDEELPESHVRLLAPGKGVEDRAASARKILGGFAERAYRRPVADDEVERLLSLAHRHWKAGGDFESGVKLSFTAALVSPRFLYRAEITPAAAEKTDGNRDKPAAVLIDEYALASRLSYFLWSSMPDDQLLAQAKAGTLRKNLAEQVKRMLADPKAAALTSSFFGQWLELRNLELVTPDPKLFRDFDRALFDAMRQETEMFIESVVREDRPLTELLSADYTFANEKLAKHYGLSDVKGDEFRRVSLAESPRRGLLGHASILTLTSNPTRTSPVKRGKWVLENVLAAPPPPPPADVPELDTAAAIDQSLPLRARMEEHRKNAACAVCHHRMDAIGFALEHFDGIGRWREIDGTAKIDAAGQLFAGQKFNGAKELTAILSGPEQARFMQCASEKMLIYALGRGLEYFDTCAVDKIVEAAKKGENRFSRLVLAVVESVPFQYVEVHPPSAANKPSR